MTAIVVLLKLTLKNNTPDKSSCFFFKEYCFHILLFLKGPTISHHLGTSRAIRTRVSLFRLLNSSKVPEKNFDERIRSVPRTQKWSLTTLRVDTIEMCIPGLICQNLIGAPYEAFGERVNSGCRNHLAFSDVLYKAILLLVDRYFSSCRCHGVAGTYIFEVVAHFFVF